MQRESIMSQTIDGGRRPPRRRRFFLIVLLIIFVFFGGRTALSYYVNALWFGSLGYGEVFRKTVTLEATVFVVFFAATFSIIYGWFLVLRRAYQPDLMSGGLIDQSATHQIGLVCSPQHQEPSVNDRKCGGKEHHE